MRQRYLLKSSNKEKTTDCSAAPLYNDVNKNIERLLNELGNSSDVSFRMVESPYQKTLKAAVIHLDGLADENIINENIMTPLIQWLKESNQVVTVKEIEEQIPQMLTVSQLTIKKNWHEFMSAVLTGDTVILLNGSSKVFIGNTKKLQSRAVTEPTSQTVVRGPKDSLTENLRTNTSLIRARIQDSNLRLDSMKIGISKARKITKNILPIKNLAISVHSISTISLTFTPSQHNASF